MNERLTLRGDRACEPSMSVTSTTTQIRPLADVVILQQNAPGFVK
jgi:hypothetical protein